ncbi:MAG TPA: glycosyltransferase family 2 protein [Candidatus Cloacimonadota bacterium]|nr:glycosyltransferase family 2 protein [Candidatus Cloacimonadota bacterium]
MRICLIVKDEYPCYLDEWLNHHEKLGKITIYNNGRDIDVIPQFGLEVIPFPGNQVQLNAYNHMAKRYPNDYILFIDSDEFFFSNYDVEQLEAECCMHGALAFNWQMYGSSGLLKHDNGSQLTKFTKKLPEYHVVNRQFKTLVQGKNVMHFSNPHEAKLRTGAYNRPTKLGWTQDVDITLGYINHYFLRSREEFELKIKKGRADTTSKRTIGEFLAINRECV